MASKILTKGTNWWPKDLKKKKTKHENIYWSLVKLSKGDQNFFYSHHFTIEGCQKVTFWEIELGSHVNVETSTEMYQSNKSLLGMKRDENLFNPLTPKDPIVNSPL